MKYHNKSKGLRTDNFQGMDYLSLYSCFVTQLFSIRDIGGTAHV